jgi:hypothetical protein
MKEVTVFESKRSLDDGDLGSTTRPDEDDS